ncbi:MAG: cytochrome-c peroxidase [Rubrivivax sp.]
MSWIRLASLSAWVLAGCAALGPSSAPSALPPMSVPADNAMTPEKVALGRQLFIDTRLSGSGKMACQSCHYRHLGWTDAQVLSRRDDGQLNTRHTPTLYNVGHQSVWYWDGRATTLEGQILAAWRGQTGADPAKVAALLNTVPGYRSQFQAVFGGEATPDAVVKALGAFMRSLNSDNSPWDRHQRGERGAVSQAAIEGFALFSEKGRCSTCHTPPYFGNSTFFNIGLEHGKERPDPGRFNVTRNEADRGAFKTPTLRSIELSGPYFHDGGVASLKEAVRYMASGGKPDPNKTPLMQPTGLTEAEIDKIVAFLVTLTSTEAWVAPTLP